MGKVKAFLQNTMEIVKKAIFNENALIYCVTHWEQQLHQLSKKYKILKKIIELEEDVITSEDLLGGATTANLQSYIDILDLKMGIMEHGRIKVIKEHPLLLDTLDKYEQFFTKLLGGHGHSLK